MATEVLMPRQGQSVESCLILSWKKAVGDRVARGESICEVETDKATFEVEAAADGVLLARLFEEGDDVPVLTPIAYIGEEGEEVPTEKNQARDASGGEGGRHATGEGPAAAAETAPSEAETAPAAAKGAPAAAPAGAVAGGDARKQGVSPRARNLADAKGVRLDQLHGSGPGGRVIERDVQAALGEREPMTPAAIESYLKGTGAPPAAGTGPGGRIRREDLGAAGSAAAAAGAPSRATAAAGAEEPPTERPVKGIRKLIAERMHASLRDTAQLTMSSSADARALLSYRKRLKESAEEALAGITINDLVHFAVVRTLLRYPSVNAHMTGETIREFKQVHLGFAVDTPRGLMVPVIRNAETMSLSQLAARAKELGQACLAGNINPDDLAGATFTVSNLGNLGIESFTPVLNPPQVAILGVCSIQPKPLMRGEEVEFVPSIGLSITIDHRALDGAPGARFLADVAAAIRDIELTLAL